MRIQLPSEACAYLEMLYYEVNGWRNLLLAAERVKATEGDYERIVRDYQSAQTEYCLALEELRDRYVPEKYKKNGYRFEVDFSNRALVIAGCDGDV